MGRKKTEKLEFAIKQNLQKYKTPESCTYLQLDARPLSRRTKKLVRHDESTYSSTEEKTCGWDRLNETTSCLIFEFLLFSDLQIMKSVCRFFHDIVNSHKIALRREVVCFHRKSGIVDDLMGVGIYPQYYKDGNLKEIRSFLDPISRSAVDIDRVRTSVWREAFTDWIPLLFNTNHAIRAFPLIEKKFALMLKAPQFRPEHALKLISCLMNSMVVQLMRDVKGDMEVLLDLDKRYAVVEEYTYDKFDRYKYELRDNLYHSEKALQGYYGFHHLLLGFVARYPVIQRIADRRVNEFMKFPNMRTKKQVPNLGEFLINLTLSKYRWDDVAPAVLQECMTRNARWILQKFPELEGSSVAICNRLRKSYEATKVSKRLLMFQTYFLGLVDAKTSVKKRDDKGLPDIRPRLEMYNRTLGRPSHYDIQRLQNACVTIMVTSEWYEYLLFVGLRPMRIPTLNDKLKEAIETSKRLRYHRPNYKLPRGGGTGACLCHGGSKLPCALFDVKTRKKNIAYFNNYVKMNEPFAGIILGHENKHDLDASPEIKEIVRELVSNGGDPNWPLKHVDQNGDISWYSVLGNRELENIVTEVLETPRWKITSIAKKSTQGIQAKIPLRPKRSRAAPTAPNADGWSVVAGDKFNEQEVEKKTQIPPKKSTSPPPTTTEPYSQINTTEISKQTRPPSSPNTNRAKATAKNTSDQQQKSPETSTTSQPQSASARRRNRRKKARTQNLGESQNYTKSQKTQKTQKTQAPKASQKTQASQASQKIQKTQKTQKTATSEKLDVIEQMSAQIAKDEADLERMRELREVELAEERARTGIKEEDQKNVKPVAPNAPRAHRRRRRNRNRNRQPQTTTDNQTQSAGRRADAGFTVVKKQKRNSTKNRLAART